MSWLIFVCSFLWAGDWAEHQRNIATMDRDIYKHQQELEVLVEKKKNTHDQFRIEETLQRIVEIHTALLTMRKKLDEERRHIEQEHPEQKAWLEEVNRMQSETNQPTRKRTALSAQLDELLLKVQLKYAQFQLPEDKNEELAEVDKVVEIKEKKQKSREADVYLRKRSKVKLER